MTDNNIDTPQLEDPNNDVPLQAQIIEKPFYDNGSEPQTVPTTHDTRSVCCRIDGSRLVCSAIILIIVSFIDIIIQIYYIFNPYLLADTVPILTMAILFLCYEFKCKSMNKDILGCTAMIIFFVGFLIRILGSILPFQEEATYIAINFIITGIRIVGLVLSFSSSTLRYSE